MGEGAFVYNALFNKDTGWQIGSVTACGIQLLQVIYEHAARLLHCGPWSCSVRVIGAAHLF